MLAPGIKGLKYVYLGLFLVFIAIFFAYLCIFIGDVMSSVSDGGCPEHHKTL